MTLLYADEAGSITDPHQMFFVLAGVSIFERQIYWVSAELDKIAHRFNPDNPSTIELHASPMYHGKGKWRAFTKAERHQALKDTLQVFANSHRTNRMFACVVRKSIITKDPVEYSFEQLSSRFDYYLRRLGNNGNLQKGIIIFDKSTYETTIQNLATDFRTIGHSWGVIKSMAEVPLFLDSKASRLIQLADIIAYAIFKHYEQGDDELYSIISNRWDKEGNENHGLCERIKSNL